MISIDLLTTPDKIFGAYPDSDGANVTHPWGRYVLKNIALPKGWYELTVAGGSSICLELFCKTSYQIIELEAQPKASAIAHLEAGSYEISVQVGSRPGKYDIEKASLQSLSFPKLINLFWRRFFQAVQTGTSLERLWKLAMRAIQSKQSYGVRSSKTITASPAHLGVLTLQDLQFSFQQTAIQKRLKFLKNKIRFLIIERYGNLLPMSSLENQFYKNFTLSPDEPYDYVITVEKTDVLLPDCLLLFAEHIFENPNTVVLADKWLGTGFSTANVAWDPLLYSESLPTPFANKPNEPTQQTFQNKDCFSIIDLPVASGGEVIKPPKLVFSASNKKMPCSIIIPTRDRADLLSACLSSLFKNTNWPFEVIIIDNGSIESATHEVFHKYSALGVRIIRIDREFNFSLLCNVGAKHSQNDYLLFLNNDVVLENKNWLADLMRYAVLEEIGAVGGRLLYADGRLQHGGVMLGLTQICGHFWRGLTYDHNIPLRLQFASLRTAVTGACLCIAKNKFETVGGFDENRFPVTLNDIDLCLKLLNNGLFNVYVPLEKTFHLEGESRGEDESPIKKKRRMSELHAFAAQWPDFKSDFWFPRTYARSSETMKFK